MDYASAFPAPAASSERVRVSGRAARKMGTRKTLAPPPDFSYMHDTSAEHKFLADVSHMWENLGVSERIANRIVAVGNRGCEGDSKND